MINNYFSIRTDYSHEYAELSYDLPSMSPLLLCFYPQSSCLILIFSFFLIEMSLLESLIVVKHVEM